MLNSIGYEKVNTISNAAILLNKVDITGAAFSWIKLCKGFIPALNLVITDTGFPRAESAGP